MYVTGWELGSLHPSLGFSEFSWAEKGQAEDEPPPFILEALDVSPKACMLEVGTQYGRET